jgi:regulator of ribonuclease activity A
MKTTDLCDEYDQQVNVAEPIGFVSFGGRKDFSGQIETVKCHEDNSLVRAAVERNGKGKVLVVDGGGSRRCALLGDNIASLAQKNEWNGFLIFGSIRDSEVVATLDIGVVALGTHPKKSAKRNEGAANIVVYFSGTIFVPGQYIYIDADGIVTSETALTAAH